MRSASPIYLETLAAGWLTMLSARVTVLPPTPWASAPTDDLVLLKALRLLRRCGSPVA